MHQTDVLDVLDGGGPLFSPSATDDYALSLAVQSNSKVGDVECKQMSLHISQSLRES